MANGQKPTAIPMITFPNAKINLGLNILSKREDGYHNISSCFIPIGWQDILEIIPANRFEFTSTGLSIPGDQSTNLCVKAFHILQQDFDIPNVKMHLHKVIPMGAGLGGGSSDGAFALKMLNEFFSLHLTNVELESYAAQLGADCPFFIQNKPTLVSGIGEIFEPVELDLNAFQIVVVFPKIHVNTRLAFSKIKPATPTISIQNILAQPIAKWKDQLINDFEKPVFEKHSELLQLKNRFYDQGAIYASMTGSGSALYGIFDRNLKFNANDFLGTQFEIWNGDLIFNT